MDAPIIGIGIRSHEVKGLYHLAQCKTLKELKWKNIVKKVSMNKN